MRRKPFEIATLARYQVDNLFSLFGKVEGLEVSIKHDGHNVRVGSDKKFCDQNSERSILVPGIITEEGLRESWFAFQGEENDAVKLARSISRKLKRFMRSGAWVVAPDFDAEAFYRNHRYTERALLLQDSGLKMLAITRGDNYVVLGERKPGAAEGHKSGGG